VDAGRSLTLRSRLEGLQLAHRVGVVVTSASATRIVRTGWLLAILAVGLQTAAQLIDAFVLGQAYPGLDAAVDRNAFDWASFCAASVAGVSLLLFAARVHGRSTAALALLVAFLAVDDLSNLHDRLGSAFARTLPEPLDRLGDWSTPVLYLPLLAATFGLLWSLGTRVPPASARQIRVALALLAAAVVLRVLIGILEIRGYHASEGMRAIGVAVLEAPELAAWTLVAAAFVAEASDVVRRANA
jgi:hypothetical protein